MTNNHVNVCVMLYYIVHNVCLLCYAYSIVCMSDVEIDIQIVSSFSKLYSRPSLFGRFMHNMGWIVTTLVQCSVGALLIHSWACSAWSNMQEAAVSDYWQDPWSEAVTLVIPQAAWNRNILVFSCKVQGGRSPNLEEADIQDVFQLSCCWVTYEGPQIAESTRWSKDWRIFWRCCGEVAVDCCAPNLPAGGESFISLRLTIS